jgi:hypothetical protein
MTATTRAPQANFAMVGDVEPGASQPPTTIAEVTLSLVAHALTPRDRHRRDTGRPGPRIPGGSR